MFYTRIYSSALITLWETLVCVCRRRDGGEAAALHVRKVQRLDGGGVQQLIFFGDQDLQPVHQHLFT